MRPTEAYADLRRFGRPVLTTRDAADRLGLSLPGASKLLTRLAADGLVHRLRRGLWSTAERTDPLTLPEHLTAPYPSYVSLLTALRIHGLIAQIPHVNYAVSLGPARRIPTVLGTFSIHRLAPEIFGGFDSVGPSAIKLATPEKALFDTLYLSRGRSRAFARLPEVEIPTGFRAAETRRWVASIPTPAHRAMVKARLDRILAHAAGKR